MELDLAIKRRRMCRDFSTDPLDLALVDRIVDLARRAPSAGYSQGWSFVLLSGPAETGAFWKAFADPEWLAAPDLPGLPNAPVIVVPLCSADVYVARYSEPDKVAHGLTNADAWPVPFWTVDVSFATMLLLLAATDEGLGALFFGFRSREAIARFRTRFGVPDSWEPIGAVALGRPSPSGTGPVGSAVRGRRRLEDVIHRGHW